MNDYTQEMSTILLAKLSEERSEAPPERGSTRSPPRVAQVRMRGLSKVGFSLDAVLEAAESDPSVSVDFRFSDYGLVIRETSDFQACILTLVDRADAVLAKARADQIAAAQARAAEVDAFVASVKAEVDQIAAARVSSASSAPGMITKAEVDAFVASVKAEVDQIAAARAVRSQVVPPVPEQSRVVGFQRPPQTTCASPARFACFSFGACVAPQLTHAALNPAGDLQCQG